MIEEKEALLEAQHGFRKQRSTLAAMDNVLEVGRNEMKRKLRTGNFVLLILMDVRNAFNRMNWGKFMAVLEKKGISTYLHRVVSSYLEKRGLEADGRNTESQLGFHRDRSLDQHCGAQPMMACYKLRIYRKG